MEKGIKMSGFYTLVAVGWWWSQEHANNAEKRETKYHPQYMGDSPNVIQCCSFELSF